MLVPGKLKKTWSGYKSLNGDLVVEYKSIAHTRKKIERRCFCINSDL